MEKQATARSLEYRDKPIGSIEDALIQNFKKGVVAGMKLVLSQPKTLCELAREEFNMKLQEERNRGSY